MAKILLVDDDLYLRDLYEELLVGAGHTVDTAVDGEEAQGKITTGGYDLVLLDMMIPKIDGRDILRSLQKSPPKTPNGPIVILSNLAAEDVRRECLTLGAADWFVKADHTPEDFLATVKKYLP